MSIIQNLYGPVNQTIALPAAINGLASGAACASSVIDNSTNLYTDALVMVRVQTASATTAGYVNVYAFGTADGVTYSDGITPGGAVTMTVPPNATLIGVIATPATAFYTSCPMNVSSAFSGILPQKWGIIIENRNSGPLNATTGGNAFYQGIQGQVV